MSDIQSYINGLRARGIALADIDDPTADAILREALYEYSRKRPVVAARVFETVADQQVYTWTEMGDADGVEALAVYWNPDSIASEWSFARAIAPYALLRDSAYWHLPSQAVVDEIKAAAWARSFSGSGYQITDGGSLYLTPTPTNSGIDVLVIYTSAYSSVTEIPTRDRDIFLDLAESMCGETMVKSLAAASAALTVKTPEYEVQMGAKIGLWRAVQKEKYARFLSKCEAGHAACGRT